MGSLIPHLLLGLLIVNLSFAFSFQGLAGMINLPRTGQTSEPWIVGITSGHATVEEKWSNNYVAKM